MKVVISQGQIVSFYIKSANMIRESGKIGENRGNFNKIGENRNFHMVSLDTASAPV